MDLKQRKGVAQMKSMRDLEMEYRRATLLRHADDADEWSSGNVAFDGKNSLLQICGNPSLPERYYSEGTDIFMQSYSDAIVGINNNGEFVSLIDCHGQIVRRTYELEGRHMQVLPSPSTGRGVDSGTFNFDYAVIGVCPINKKDKLVSCIRFKIEDGRSMFRSSKQSGTIVDTSIVQNIAKAKVGEVPFISYYTDSDDPLLSVDTSVGILIATQHTTYKPQDALSTFSNDIEFRFDFHNEQSFSDAILNLEYILLFFGLLLGKAQCLLSLEIEVKGSPLSVYCTEFARFSVSNRGNRYIASFIDPILDNEQFLTVLASFVNQCRDMTNAQYYSIGTLFNYFFLIGAPSIGRGIADCKKMFEYADYLGSEYSNGKQLRLGLIKDITSRLGGRLPGFDELVRRAIEVRDADTHGSIFNELKLSKGYHVMASPSVAFLTETLIFLFGVSMLIKLGCGVAKCLNDDRNCYHPFATYVTTYKSRRAALYKEIQSQ